jgi:hypothetical protein
MGGAAFSRHGFTPAHIRPATTPLGASALRANAIEAVQ